MARKKHKYRVVVVNPIKELYTDNKGVSAMVVTNPKPTQIGLMIRYPKGWEYEEEDLPVATDRLNKGLASPVVIQTLLNEAIQSNASHREFGEIASYFLRAGLALLKLDDQYKGLTEKISDKDQLKYIRAKAIENTLSNTTKWEESMSASFERLDDWLVANDHLSDIPEVQACIDELSEITMN